MRRTSFLGHLFYPREAPEPGKLLCSWCLHGQATYLPYDTDLHAARYCAHYLESLTQMQYQQAPRTPFHVDLDVLTNLPDPDA